MFQYQLLYKDAEGLSGTPTDIAAVDDAEAIELIRLRLETQDIELWCGERKVVAMRKGEALG